MDHLNIAGVTLESRLMLGTGKFKDLTVMQEAFRASQTQVVTVSVRRVESGAAGHVGLMDALELDRYRLLPNTAGATNAQEAVHLAKLGRVLSEQNWVKLEVIPDAKHLFPDSTQTLLAAQMLVDEGFVVLPYMMPDLLLAKALTAAGCATVMPLASPIGSGRGLENLGMIRTFIAERAEAVLAPVVVDAGLRLPSEAATVMEIGADAVLANTAIAEAADPVSMAYAFGLAVQAGRAAYLAQPMQRYGGARPSSPAFGIPTGAKAQ